MLHGYASGLPKFLLGENLFGKKKLVYYVILKITKRRLKLTSEKTEDCGTGN